MLSQDLKCAVPRIVLAVSLVIWLVVAIAAAMQLWFFGDDFDFLLNRSVTLRGDGGLLVPHNEHWSTVPILVYRFNFALFGLHHYMAYAVLPLLCHLAVALMTFALLRRAGARSAVAVLSAVIALFVAAGAGWENVLWDFQIGFLGSCISGLAALLVLARGPRMGRRQLWAALVLTVGMMCSGIALLATFWTWFHLVLRAGARTAIRTVALPVTTFLLWFATFGHGHHGAPPPDVSVAWRAVPRGLVHVWSAATLIPVAGIVVPVALVAVLVLGRKSHLFPLAASGMATLVAAYALFGYTRSGLGMDATLESRYAYFGVLFCVPALALGMELCAEQFAGRSSAIVTTVWSCTALFAIVVGSAGLLHYTQARRPVTVGNEPRLVAAANLVGQHGQILRPRAVPIFDAGFSMTALSSPAVRRALPRVVPGPQVDLDVASHLQVAVSRTSLGLPVATPPFWRDDPSPPRAISKEGPYRCETRSADSPRVMTLQLGERAAQFRIRTTGDRLVTSLVSGEHVSESVIWRIRPNALTFVGASARNATLQVQVPAGRTTVCGS